MPISEAEHAFCFRYSLRTYASLVPIVAGVAIASITEISFDPVCFLRHRMYSEIRNHNDLRLSHLPESVAQHNMLKS